MTITKTDKDTRKKVKETNETPNVTRTEYDNGDVVFTAKVINKEGREHEETFLSPASLGLEEIPRQQAIDYVKENNYDPLISKIDIVKSMKGKGFRVVTEVGKYSVDEVFLKEDYAGGLQEAKNKAECLAKIIKTYGSFYKEILEVREANKAPNSDRTYSSPHSEYNLNFIPGKKGGGEGHFVVKAKVRKKLRGDLLSIQKVVTIGRFDGDIKEAKNTAKEIRSFWIKSSIDFLYEQLVCAVKGESFSIKAEKMEKAKKEVRRKIFELEARLDFMELKDEELEVSK